jgi:hypothetical protein
MSVLLAGRIGSSGVESAAEGMMRPGKDVLVGTAGRHGELDPADADGDEGTDLEEVAADGAAGGVGEIGRQGPRQYIRNSASPSGDRHARRTR